MLSKGRIAPHWDINEFKELNYKADTHKDQALLEQYAHAGHSMQSMALYNYFQPNPLPQCVENYIMPYFNYLENIGVAVNYFKPAQYLPVHVDLFGRYSEVHQIAAEEITRIIIMLEDSQPGQISQECDETVGKWSAGDWFQWDSADAHAFYNFSTRDRYAIQLTGTKRQKTLDF